MISAWCLLATTKQPLFSARTEAVSISKLLDRGPVVGDGVEMNRDFAAVALHEAHCKIVALADCAFYYFAAHQLDSQEGAVVAVLDQFNLARGKALVRARHSPQCFQS